MSYLLEILGRGLLAELAAAFRDLLRDDGHFSTQELESYVEREPECVKHRRQLAIRLLADRKYGQARDSFLDALAIDPADRVSRIGLACTLDELGLTQAAIEHLRTTLTHHADDGATFFALGFCQEKLGEIDEAIVSYESTLDITPQLRNAHERLAAIYLRLDNMDMAITHYEHLCWCEPDDLAAGLTLASLYLRAKRFEDAIRQYQYVITIEPDNWEAQDDLVTACVDAGRHEDAIEILQQLIEQRPQCADQYLQLGDLYSKTGRESEALASYQRAVELNPDYLEATIKVGVTHLRGGDYIEAARVFNSAIEINDRILSAYVGLGVAQQALGKTEDAQASLEMAAEIEPNSTVLFSEMARLQLRVSAAAQADRYLSPRAIAATPQGPLDDDVATVVQRQIASLRATLKEHPNHADLHYRLGLLLRHDGDLVGAIDAFYQATSINPQYLAALTKLALALRETGRTDEAMNVLKRALEVDPESIDLHYQLGLMFADRNEFASALDRFEYTVAKEPHNLDYIANVVLALQNMGLLDRASAGWQTLCEVARQTSRASRLLQE